MTRSDETSGEVASWTELARLLAAQDPGDAIRWYGFPTPFGPTYVAASGRGLVRVSWTQEGEGSFIREMEARFRDRPVVRDPDALAAAESQLRAYFEGRRRGFDLPLDLTDLPSFQKDVLQAVCRVDFGDVVPYAELARRIRRPRAYRAVGNALGRNPVAIVVPCHRVVRSDGGLGGYTGGLEYKEHLLSLEGREDLLRTG